MPYAMRNNLNIERINVQIKFKRLMDDVRRYNFIKSMGKCPPLKDLNREIMRLHNFKMWRSV